MDCQKCHALTSQEIKEVLKDLKAPDAEVLKVQLSPIRGLWEIAIDNKGTAAPPDLIRHGDGTGGEYDHRPERFMFLE